MNEEDGYCGFVCQDVLDNQQKIIDEIKDFSKYNPEFAVEMARKIIEMCIQSRIDLTISLITKPSQVERPATNRS